MQAKGIAVTYRVAPVLTVGNLKAAIAWYREALGFEPVFINRADGDQTGESWVYALIDHDDAQIHLSKIVRDDRTLSSPSNCYVYVEQIEQLHDRLQELGADVTAVEEMPWGNRECWLHDPDGNRLVLSEPL